MIAKDADSYVIYQEFLSHFPNDLYAILAFEKTVCSEEGWGLLLEADEAASNLSSTYKTISLASSSSKIIGTSGTDIYIDSLRDIHVRNASDRCRLAVEYSPFNNALISADSETSVLLVFAKQGTLASEFSAQIHQLRDDFSPRVEKLGGRILLTGDPIMSTAIAETMASDLRLVALLIVLMLLCVQLTVRSRRVTLTALVTILYSILGALGIASLFDIHLTPGSALAIFLLAPLSTAFVIHASGYHTRTQNPQLIPQEAILPTIFAGLTTAALFGATGFTVSPDVKSLAFIGVVGILCATVAIFLFVFPSLYKKDVNPLQITIPRWAFLYPAVGYGILGLLILWVGFGLMKLNFEYEAVDYLPLDHQSRVEFEEVGSKFGRMTIPLMLDIEELNDIKTWVSLEDALQEIQTESAEPILVDWLYEPISELHATLTDSKTKSFPEDSITFDQIFLWFDQRDIDHLVGDEGKRLTVFLNVNFIGSQEYYELKKSVDSALESHNLTGRLTGRVAAFFETGHRVGIDNLIGLLIATTLVGLILLVIFRSALLACIVLTVNAIPALSALATLSIAGIPIDLGSSVVTAIAFGIIVDDSTHLVVRIRRLQRAGFDPSTAVVKAVHELAPPIIFTSLTLSVGFAVLFAAELRPFHDFATTILVSLSTAILADLVILPTLVKQLLRDPLSDLKTT
jgi:predicted RND superfamily exporter protein